MPTLYLLRRSLIAVAATLVVSCASTDAPDQTFDGLVLQPGKGSETVYVRPGAEFSGYTEYGLVPCQVAFRKNWLREQNNSRMDLSSRVTQKDVDTIKDNLAAACDQRFREALLEDPAYTLVETFGEGEPVLILRPNIVDLDVNAPDVMSSGRTRSYTTSAGEMTLFLEVLDGTTGEIQARVVDRRSGVDTNRLQWSSGVTNRAEADRMLKRWASDLRKALDRVNGS